MAESIEDRRRGKTGRPWRVKLYARPASLRGVNLAELEEATSLDDQPFGVLELEDGSRLAFAVVRARCGGLCLNVEGAAVRLLRAGTR